MLPKKLLLLFLLSCMVSHAQEKIYSFHAQLHVQKNALLTVTENIKIRAEGDVFQHGIFRSFPLNRNINNRNVRIEYDVLSVSKNGKTEPFFTQEKGDEFYLYIGDKDTNLAHGDYAYEIVYSSEQQIGYFSDYDELYWNVNGFQWDFPIPDIGATVILPPEAEILQNTCYTGTAGSTEQICTMKQVANNQLNFQAQRLSAYENLTIAVGFSKGVVVQVPDNTTGISFPTLSIIFFLIFGLYSILTWLFFGKDPAVPAPYPQFRPPKDMSPAYMNYLIKEKIDVENSFTASIVNLAVKGYIYIQEQTVKRLGLFSKKTMSLHLVKKPDNRLPKEEKLTLKKLFPDDEDTYILDGKPDGILRYILDDYGKSMKTQLKSLVNKGKNTGLIIFPILLFIGFWVAAYFVDKKPVIALFVSFVAGLIVSVVLLSLIVFRIIRFLRPQTEMKIYKIAAFIAITAMYFFILWQGNYLTTSAILLYVISVIFVGGIFIYTKVIKKPSLELVKMQSEIQGFKMYLGAAEEKQLQMFNPPKMTPEIFQKFLPYAIVLGVAKIWGKRFERMVEFGGMPNQGNKDDYWYRGTDPMSASVLANHLSTGINSSVTKGLVNTSSSDSGSDGDGFSGGGGGGGGGGGW